MDSLRRVRGAYRSLITRIASEILSLIEEKSDVDVIRAKWGCLVEYYSKVTDYDRQVIDKILEDNLDGELDEEIANSQEYQEKFLLIKCKVDRLYNEVDARTTVSSQPVTNAKYPKITLKTIDDDLKQWLGFWAQFRDIHENEELPVADKFQYLTPNGEKRVRVLLDGGTQRTYVREAAAESLGMEPTQTEWLQQTGFGGFKSAPTPRDMYELDLKPLIGPGKRKVTALSQRKMCGNIPKLRKGPWLKELKRNQIWINDMSDDLLDIDILIGSDVYGRVLTGKMNNEGCGLTAMETIWGWTLLGLAHDIANGGLARMEKEEFVRQRAMPTVRIDDEGKHEKKPPWIRDKGEIPDNKENALKRLTRKLIEPKRFPDYDSVFKEWEEMEKYLTFWEVRQSACPVQVSISFHPVDEKVGGCCKRG